MHWRKLTACNTFFPSIAEWHLKPVSKGNLGKLQIHRNYTTQTVDQRSRVNIRKIIWSEWKGKHM